MGVFEEEYVKNCPYCTEQFEAKRINQKFCSYRCKYTFNNRKRKDKEIVKACDTKILDKNHSVLKVLFVQDNSKKYSKSVLIKSGFSFEYLTRNATTKEGKQVIGIYNFGLFQETDGLFTIKKIA